MADLALSTLAGNPAGPAPSRLGAELLPTPSRPRQDPPPPERAAGAGQVLSPEAEEICSRPGPWTRIASPSEWMHAAFGPIDEEEFEAALDASVSSSLEFAMPGAEYPELRRNARVESLTGRRFGRLLVLGPEIRVRRTGWFTRDWMCRCDCGQITVVSGSRLRQGTHQCKPCGNRETARARKACRSAFGVPMWVLAERAGLPLSTIHTRVRRGYSYEQVVAPRQRPGTKVRRAA